VTAALERDASKYTWVAATIGANSAAGYQLATGDPILAIGGFNGTDPTPTLAEFQRLVGEGRIHYYIAGGGGPGAGASGSSSAITRWVESSFAATTVDGLTLYDMTAAQGATTS
jgi:4-amino-4-deoxy-L-arabinose transferase-like glycosyltransferase